MSEPLHRDPKDRERNWPPRTLREWIDLERYDMERDGSPKAFKDGYDEALNMLDHFLAWDYEHFEEMGPGEATNYPPRTAPPDVGPETEWGHYP
jgi:hypothetical protein